MKEKFQFRKNNAELAAFFSFCQVGKGRIICQNEDKIFSHIDHECSVLQRESFPYLAQRTARNLIKTAKEEKGKRIRIRRPYRLLDLTKAVELW